MDIQQLEQRISDLEAELSRLREDRIPQVDRSSRRRDRRLTIAYLVAGVVAVGLAGVGSASALDGSNTVFSDDIVDGTVAGVDVRDGSIGGVDIKNSSLAGTDVADGSLTGADINLTSDNQCNGETVQGTAVVNADPAVPATFTTEWLGWQHSCTGEAVQVKRDYRGHYEVKFGASSPSRLAVVTITDTAALPSPTITARNTAPGLFVVDTYEQLVGGPDLVDADFMILAY